MEVRIVSATELINTYLDKINKGEEVSDEIKQMLTALSN